MITLFIRCAAAVMLNSIMLTGGGADYSRKALLSGEGVYARTYARIYYKGGGWYTISGFAADGSDVRKVIDQIDDLKAHKAVLKEGGYYFDKKGKMCGTYSTLETEIGHEMCVLWDKINDAVARQMKPILPTIAVKPTIFEPPTI